MIPLQQLFLKELDRSHNPPTFSSLRFPPTIRVHTSVQKDPRSEASPAKKSFPVRRSLEPKPAPLRKQITQKLPSAPPPTLEKSSRSEEGFLEKMASEMLRKTLNFAPPPDKNVLALSEVSAKLADVQAQAKDNVDPDEMMRKVPIVNEDLAAKLARRRDWEATEEAKNKAAKLAAKMLEDEKKARLLSEQQAQKEEEMAQAKRALELESEYQLKQDAQVRKFEPSFSECISV